MYYLKIIYISLFFLLFSCQLFATTYEDASDKKTYGWHVLKQFSKGKVKNIYDKDKRSRVIKLTGNATRTVYMLTSKKKIFKRKKGENILSWEMNYKEDFVIMIGVDTTNGKRFLIYTSGDSNSYLQYGLGSDSISGQWKKYYRDLQKDLEYSEKDNKFLNITNFVIKGSGMVDNIKMIKSRDNISYSTISIKKDNNVSKEIVKKAESPKEEIKESRDNTPPIIEIKGANPMIIKKGESYIEPGVSAKNIDGSSVMVSISDDIDILTEGEYSVIYMATNDSGDSVIDRRRVIVGKVTENKKSKKEKSKDESEEEELEEEVLDLEQRTFEMLEWEKELAFREKELLEEKKRRATKSQNPNYPSHPGL